MAAPSSEQGECWGEYHRRQGTVARPSRGDIAGYVAAMVLRIVTGVLGAILHIDENLASRGLIIAEWFVTGVPFMARLLFANTGLFGLVAILDPHTERVETPTSAPGL